MPQVFEQLAKFGTATTVYFTLEDPLATGSDKLVTASIAALPIVAGDVKISKDGGAVANTTNLPTQVTAAQPHYSLVLTATEMQAEWAMVTLQDQTTPAAWRSTTIRLNTRMRLGQIDVDTTQIGGNVTAMNLQGVGTGSGLRGIGGNSAPVANGDSCGICGLSGTGGGVGINAIAGTGGNGNAIAASGDGSGNALALIAGATGEAMNLVAGSTSGKGIEITTTNGDAILLTPAGTGKVTINEASKGIFGVVRAQTIASSTASTAVLDGAASAVDDFYNEQALGIVAGTGSGQWRMITDYTGASKTCNINRPWTTNPNGTSSYVIRIAADVWDQLEGAEPSGSYASGTGNFRRIMQYLLRRFFNKVTQTISEQKVFKDDSATVLTVMAVSDDGTTQSKGKSS